MLALRIFGVLSIVMIEKAAGLQPSVPCRSCCAPPCHPSEEKATRPSSSLQRIFSTAAEANGVGMMGLVRQGRRFSLKRLLPGNRGIQSPPRGAAPSWYSSPDHRRVHCTSAHWVLGEYKLAHSGAVVALPLLGRFFSQASNLFQFGALFGTIPTLLAGLVCCYWAWQVSVWCRCICDMSCKTVAHGSSVSVGMLRD